MVQQINLQTKISTEFLEFLGEKMLFLESKELLEESRDIWENIKIPKEEKEDSDEETDLERDPNDKGGSFKERVKTQPGKADDDILLFEKQYEDITKARPGRK